jgi:hypothetical protein
MANIDKKLAKKLAKMPEEERQAFLENLRLQEEENQRKKEEMLLRFLKVRSTHALVRAILQCPVSNTIPGQAGKGRASGEGEPVEAAEPMAGHHATGQSR